MLMAATALLRNKPQPTEQEISAAMTNLCRRGAYPRLKRAIFRASGQDGGAP
jgi:isoquinoline 1-oxidoreductase alpha subunit